MLPRRRPALTRLALATALAATPLLGQAFSGITDTAGDLLATFAGAATSTDLDVLSATVFYDVGADKFLLTSTQAGAVGSTANGIYVWGVNRGAGTAGFAANGISGVRFDRVVILRPDGSGTVAGVGNLPAGSVTVSGNTISAIVSGSMLVSTGFNKIDYTFNLWPRDATFAGFVAISDFAPDNANFTATPGLVPEPGTWVMFGAGLAALGFMARRRRR
jgi:PEP-CTERM motif